MSTQAIEKELARVRKMKSAYISELELLRSDSEQGKIHIRVCQDKDFRDRVAEAVVKEAHPSWSWEYQGRYFADPVEGKVFFRESNAPWNPWSDQSDWRIVPVDELVEQEGNDFDPSPCDDQSEEEAEELAVDFAFGEIKDEIIIKLGI